MLRDTGARPFSQPSFSKRGSSCLLAAIVPTFGTAKLKETGARSCGTVRLQTLMPEMVTNIGEADAEIEALDKFDSTDGQRVVAAEPAALSPPGSSFETNL